MRTGALIRTTEKVPRTLEKTEQDLFRKMLEDGLTEGATSVEVQASVPIKRPHEVLMEDFYESKEAMNDRLNRRLSETNATLRRNLWILGTIGSSAPFVGLFGTVLGIMESFKSIGESGKSGFSVVAVGISEALIATASGIIVAVIAVIFYNYFQTKVAQIASDFRNRIEDTAELIFLAKRK
jgi:biopolymer transport protein ExbB/TolQ